MKIPNLPEHAYILGEAYGSTMRDTPVPGDRAKPKKQPWVRHRDTAEASNQQERYNSLVWDADNRRAIGRW